MEEERRSGGRVSGIGRVDRVRGWIGRPIWCGKIERERLGRRKSGRVVEWDEKEEARGGGEERVGMWRSRKKEW